MTSSTSIEQIRQTVIESRSILFDLDEFHGMLNKVQDKNSGDQFSSFFNHNYSDTMVSNNYRTTKGGYTDEGTNVQMNSTQPVFFQKLLTGEIYHSGYTDRFLFMPLLRDKKRAKRNTGISTDDERYINKVLSLYKDHQQPLVTLQLTDEAYYRHVDFTNELHEMQKKEAKGSIIHGYYDKLDIALSKLTIIYHLMHGVYSGKDIEPIIQFENVNRAFQSCIIAVNAFQLCLEVYSGEFGENISLGVALKKILNHYPHVTQYEMAKTLGVARQNVSKLIKTATKR